MIHRECGVLKTTYEADMALYPLPIARYTVGVLAVLFVLVIPLTLHEYFLSIANLVWIADHRRARPQHPRRLHGAGVHRPRRVHVGGRLHGRQLRDAPRFAVARQPRGRRPDGRADRRGGRHPVPPHQGAVPGHRHPGRPADHRVDDQPRHVHQRRRAGVHRGAAPAHRVVRPRQPAGDVLLPAVLRRPRHRGHDEPHAQPRRARLHRDPRPGHRRRDHRHQHLPLQAAGVRRSRRSTRAPPACSTPISSASPTTSSSRSGSPSTTWR